MRILHVSAYFAPAFVYGGPPVSLLALCRALADAGAEVRVATTSANGDRELAPGRRRDLGIDVHYCARRGPRRLFFAPDLPAAVRDMLGGVDVVHLHGLFNAAVWQAAAVARRRGVPYIVSPRGMLQPSALAHHSWRKRVAARVFDEHVLAGAALLHASSSLEAATLRARCPGRQVAEVAHGIEAPPETVRPRENARRALGLPGGPLVVFLGRIHPIKRLDLLAAAFARMRQRATLVIAGPDEDGHRRTIEPLFAPVGDRVRWVGPLDTAGKWNLLSIADALVTCSDSESFGMSVVEAMAAGLPVVATRTCPWSDLERWRCGMWVDQHGDALAAALDTLLANPEAARAMGDRGRAIAVRRFTWPAIAREMMHVYAAASGAVPPAEERIARCAT